MKDNYFYWILHNQLAGNDCLSQQEEEQHQQEQEQQLQEKHNLQNKQDSSDRNDEKSSSSSNKWKKNRQQQQVNPSISFRINHKEIAQNKNNSMNNISNEGDKIFVTDINRNRFNFVKRIKFEDKDISKIRLNNEQELRRHLLQKQQQQQQLHEQQQYQQQQQPSKIDDEYDINLSFCGCGFLGIYHVGVASCFLEYAPQLSTKKVAGSSAGSLVAVAYICGNLQLAYATTDILRTAIDARARALGPFHPSFDINTTIREALERVLPDDVYLRASGVLHISLTRVYDGENVIISQFDSKEDVIQAIICSCFIPFWSGLKTPKYKGVTYMDGGFSNNLLILDNKTVSVSPFAGEADICPQDDTLNLLQVSVSNTSFSLSPNNLYRLSHALLPPRPEILSDLCEQGFADGIRFLQQMKLISCTKCLEIRSSLLVAADEEEDEEEGEEEEEVVEEVEEVFTNSLVSTTSQIYCQRQEQLPEELQQQQGVDNCDECVSIRQKALRNPLPKQFSDRIREACDTVNESLANWIYSHRPIKYLSYLAAPYYLPIEFSLALVYRCWRQLPSISPELVDCVYNILDLLVGIVRRVNARSTSSLLLESSLSWEYNANIEYEKEITGQKVKLSSTTKSSLNLRVSKRTLN